MRRRPSLRQRQVLDHAAAGLTNREIAEVLEISPHTIKDHMRHAQEVLGARNRTEAVAEAIRRGEIE